MDTTICMNPFCKTMFCKGCQEEGLASVADAVLTKAGLL